MLGLGAIGTRVLSTAGGGGLIQKGGNIINDAVGRIGKVIGIGGNSAANTRDDMRASLASLGFRWRTKHGEDPNDIDAFDNTALSNLRKLYKKYGRPVVIAYNEGRFTKSNLQSMGSWDSKFSKSNKVISPESGGFSGLLKLGALGTAIWKVME